MSSKVYFTNLKTRPGVNLLDKLEKLVKKAGIGEIDFKNKFVAVKIHFGETGNLAYIRHNYAKRVASIVKELGGNVFLTDASTLYSGTRSNAVDHLTTAFENGFNPMSVGCNVIIADGLKGTEYREITINQKNCKTAKIGSAIADSDIVISMNHFKGHEMTGFGGCLKNVGMGSGSKAGKLEMHSASKPYINAENCIGCQQCFKNCNHGAITIEDKKAVIDYEKCIGCGQCVAMCMFDSASVNWNEAADTAAEKIAEYSLAVLKDKPSFHISFITNVSPNCDCWSSNDVAIVPDIGILASFDPVALDHACYDLVNDAPTVKGSAADKEGNDNKDKFRRIHSRIDGTAILKYAESIGLGSIEYELVEV